MYYLQQRYYDPFTCRFISPDSIIAEGQGTSSYNIFAYCGNNPIMYADHTGNVVIDFIVSATQLIATLVGVAGVVANVGNPVAIAGMAVAAWFALGSCILDSLDMTSSFVTNGVIDTIAESFSCVELEDVLVFASAVGGCIRIKKAWDTIGKAIEFTAELVLGAFAVSSLLPDEVTLYVDDPTYVARVFYIVACIADVDGYCRQLDAVIQNYAELSCYIFQNFSANLDVDALASSHSAQELFVKVHTGQFNV